jgi:aminopeptidase N
MKILVFSLTLTMASLGIFAQTLDFNPNTINEIAEAEAKSYTAGLLSPEVAPSGNYDVTYHRMALTIDPAIRYIKGNISTYFKTLEANFAAIYFDLNQPLRVDSVLYHGKKTTYTHTDMVLKINLPKALGKAVLDSLTIYWQGAPADNGFGSFEQTTHNGVPVIWTLSEPYGARDWWPCKQTLTDKIDSLDTYVTCPKAYVAAGNGLLVEELAIGNNKLFHWKHRYPIANYLVAFAVTNYDRYTDYANLQKRRMPIENYVYPESKSNAQIGTKNLIPVIELYDSLFVDYPFYKEKYGHAQFGWGGGMEHQTMTFVVSYGYELLAHELAHQWFGDNTTCGSWSDIWLNEGFATYLSGLAYEFLQPNNWYGFKSGRINSVLSSPGGSVFVTDTSSVNSIFSSRLSYNKGAMVLHMLRWKLGDQAFFQGVRNYLKAPEHEYGFAKTPQFKAHLEAAGKQDLTEFFKDWYYGQGYPTYQISARQDADQKVVIKINQTTSHSSVNFFEMPVPIQLTSADGKTYLARLEHTFSGQEFTVYPGFKISKVQFDPQLWLIAKTADLTVGTQEVVKGGFSLYPNPTTDQARLVVETRAGSIRRIQLSNASGALIQNADIQILNNHEATLDLTRLPAGMYFARVETEKGVWMQNVVKM